MMSERIAKFLLIMMGFALIAAGASAHEAKLGVDDQAETGSVTGLAIPRHVSLRSDKVYVRSGPGMRYPIQWIYKRRDMPVQVTREFGTWRRIKDFEGEEGWVHQSLLSSRRFGLVTEAEDTVFLFRRPDAKALRRARIEPGVIVRFEEDETVCKDGWCRVSADGFKGWVEEKKLWGVDASHESDIE